MGPSSEKLTSGRGIGAFLAMGIYTSSAASNTPGVGSRQFGRPARLSPFGLLNQVFCTFIIQPTLVNGLHSVIAAKAPHV